MRIFALVLFVFASLHLSGQSAIISRIDSILDTESTVGEYPGFTVGILHDGKLLYHGSRGLANLEYVVPFNDSTLFGLASITKQFTAACIAILEKQGKLSVNDDVRAHIPELAFYGDTIRIRHLMNHTSGIRNHNVLLDLKGFDYAHQGYTNEMIQELMFKQKAVNDKPGEKVLYSNTNYVLLALVVNRVSGLSIDQFADQEIFQPLGMRNTFYVTDLEQVDKNRAYPYYKSKEEYKQPKSLTLCIGAGGVVSTVEDMLKWSDVFLDPRSAFSYVSSFLSTTVPLNNGEATTCARGVFVSPYREYETINHGGRGVGMRSQLTCVPDEGLSVVIYTNSEHINAQSISYKLLDLFLKEPTKSENSASQPFAHDDLSLRGFLGDYQELNSDLRMTFTLDKGVLFAKSSFGREPVPLSSKAAGEFHRADNESVTYAFNDSASDEIDLRIDFGGAVFYFEKVKLVAPEENVLDDFTGIFYSEELDVSYKLSTREGKLVLAYPNNPSIFLTSGRRDEFGSGRRTRYSFIRNETGEVDSFEVAAEGTVKGILFEKMKD